MPYPVDDEQEDKMLCEICGKNYVDINSGGICPDCEDELMNQLGGGKK